MSREEYCKYAEVNNTFITIQDSSNGFSVESDAVQWFYSKTNDVHIFASMKILIKTRDCTFISLDLIFLA